MTVSNQTNRSGPYIGNGVTTVFARTFKMANEDHLAIYQNINGVISEVLSGVTIDGVGDESGNVTFLVPPAVGVEITLVRRIPLTQETDYSAQGKVSPEQVEDDFDIQEMQIQDLSGELDRAIKLPVGDYTGELSDIGPGDAVIRRTDEKGFIGGGLTVEFSEVDLWFGLRNTASALALSGQSNGLIGFMAGELYQVDSGATGSESATADIGVDGLRPYGIVRPAHYGDELRRAIENTDSGEIYLGAETLTVDYIHLTKNIRIFGQGRKKSLIEVTGYTTYDTVNAAVVASGADADGLGAQMGIFGVDIDIQSAVTNVNGLLVMRKLNMDEVHIHDAPNHGIVIRSGVPTQQAVYFADFRNVWSKGHGASGMRITDNSNANKFELCQFDNNGTHGVHQLLIGLSGVNQAVYSNVFVGGQASYNQKHGMYIQNGANVQGYGFYGEYNSQVDGGNPKTGAYKNLQLGSTVPRCHFVMGEQGTDVDIEDTIGLNTVANNFVSVGGKVLTPHNELVLGYPNVGSGRTIKLQGAGGCEHTIEFYEGLSIVSRLRYNGTPASPSNEIRMEVTSDNGTTWKTLWHGTNNGFLSFFDKTPTVGRQNVPAAATDASSTQSLANALRNLVVNLGLAE